VSTPADLPVDLLTLAGWMDGQGLGTGPLHDVDLLAGGTQNILLRFTRSGRNYVLRRPPLNKRANSDETMRREARVLAALAGSAVPRPGLIARCDGTDVLGAAFYLMEPVDGYNPTTWQPTALLTDLGWQRRLGFAMVEGIAALSTVDVDTPALADFGRREGWLERQPARWRKQLDSYADIPGYPGPALPHVDAVAGWLERHRPASWVPGLLHGDCHFANVMLRHDGPELAALVDWELTTIGDPLLDLGHLLAMWPTNQPDESPMAPLNLPGLPTEDEIVAHYAAAGGRDIADLPWYRVLACYRLGIILEGSNARACAGLATREVGDRLGRAAHALFSQAHELTG
jgi:aminoglycoside phosphotransferase (APT) family kinase protein